MRLPIILPALLLLSAVALGQEARPTFDSLMADSAKAKYLKDGIKTATKYLKQEAELAAMKRGATESKVEKERRKWREWLDGSKDALGIDLHAYPRIVIDVLDAGRASVIHSMVKLKKGTLDYGSQEAPGYSRGQIAYTVLVPKDYAANKVEKPIPLVVTMHGRAINLRHPALKKSPEERSRIVVWNNWLGDRKTPGQNAVILAPTGRPEGFSFAKAPQFARQTLFLALGAGHTYYRTDPLRTFVEVYGDMIQVASLDSNLFAGIIWRDREDQQNVPVSDEESMVFDNLNGKPFYYVADKKMWKAVGAPMSKALKAAYERAGKPDNLIIEQVERDANGALRADREKMAKFLEAKLEMPQREFKWHFWNSDLVGPLPVLLTRADYSYDATEKIAAMPLRDRCGTIHFKANIEMIKGEDGKEAPHNVIDMKITEAQSAKLFLYEPLVDLDLPVTVKVNDKIVFGPEKVKRNWALFEQFCMPRRFFTFPVVATIDVEFDVMPRVKPEPEKEGADGAEGTEGADSAGKTDGGEEGAGE